jgi:hypothetical protein
MLLGVEMVEMVEALVEKLIVKTCGRYRGKRM